jgi:hypothetical protein
MQGENNGAECPQVYGSELFPLNAGEILRL